MTTTETRHPRAVALPSGAVEAGTWEVDADGVSRIFAGPTRGVGAVQVGIVGEQDYSGDVLYRRALLTAKESNRSRAILELDEAELRHLAADALSSADELRALGTMR